MGKRYAWSICLGWSVFVLAALACSLPVLEKTALPEADEGQIEEERLNENGAEGGESEAPELAGSPEGMDLAPCPVKQGAMILKFSANMKIEVEGMVLQHTLNDGILNLWVEDGSGPVYRVYSLEQPAIPFSVTGTVTDCSLEGEGRMTPDAYGTCKDGVVRLTIVEDWGAPQGMITCEDRSSDFPMQALGRIEHTGADGMGEVFYLDRSFSDAGPGQTSIRPFAMGQGEHIWTIFVDPYFVKP